MRRVEAERGEPIRPLLQRLLFEEELTQQEVALQLGVSYGTLVGWIMRLGLTRAEVARQALRGNLG